MPCACQVDARHALVVMQAAAQAEATAVATASAPAKPPMPSEPPLTPTASEMISAAADDREADRGIVELLVAELQLQYPLSHENGEKLQQERWRLRVCASGGVWMGGWARTPNQWLVVI